MLVVWKRSYNQITDLPTAFRKLLPHLVLPLIVCNYNEWLRLFCEFMEIQTLALRHARLKFPKKRDKDVSGVNAVACGADSKW